MGTLWTEAVTPAELTGFARAAIEDVERQKGTLAVFLPNDSVPDVVVRTVVDSDGTGELAQYRSFDAETPIASGGKGSRKTFELLPLGLKERVGEYDQLRRQAGAMDLVKAGIENATLRVSQAVVDRLEVARGQVLDTGRLVIDENGVTQIVDYGRPSGNNITAEDPWNRDGSDPVEYLISVCDLYADLNQGSQPGVVLTSRKVVARLQRSETIRAIVATLQGAPSIVSREALTAALASFGLPPLSIYDRKIRGQHVLDPDAVYLLPAAGGVTGQSPLGATFYGQTLEASEPEYGLAPVDQPGLVVGSWKTKDPIGVWVHSNAIAMPVLVNPVASMVVRVIVESKTYTVSFGGATGGNAVLTFGGNTTAPIAHNASAANVKSALVALDDGYKAADWEVTGSAGEYTIVTPGGALSGDGSGLTAGALTIQQV